MPASRQPSGAELAPKALEIAHGFAASGLTEATGRNDGEQIDKIESFFGMQGEPYCAMGLAFCYMKAYAFLTGQPTDNKTLKAILANDLPRYFNPSPSCGAIITAAKQKNIWQPFEDTASILPGDLVLFSFSSGTPRRAQHVGIFDHAVNGKVVCVEFNTSAGAAGSQADGQGCFVRQRSPSAVMGSVRVNRPGKHTVVASDLSLSQPARPVEELKIILLADNRVIECNAIVEDGRTRVDMRPICDALHIPLPAGNALQDLQPIVVPPGVTRMDLRPLAENNGWELLTHRMAEDRKIYLKPSPCSRLKNRIHASI